MYLWEQSIPKRGYLDLEHTIAAYKACNDLDMAGMLVKSPSSFLSKSNQTLLRYFDAVYTFFTMTNIAYLRSDLA